MKKLIKILVLLLMIFSVNMASAQDTDTTKYYKVIKTDGESYIGQLISDDGREVLILTKKLGKIFIPKSDIKSIELIENTADIVNGTYRSKSVFNSRYHFTTNALKLKKGDGYALVNLWGPEIHYSITDRFSAGIMASWIASPIAIALKYTIPTNNEKVNFGLGSITGTSGWIGQFRGFGGLHWGMITIGDEKRNMTFSAGYGHIGLGDIEIRDEGTYTYFDPIPRTSYRNRFGAPAFSLGAIATIGDRATFVFDAMLFASGKPTYPYAVTSSNDNGELVVTHESRSANNAVLYVMPGIRFQKSERRAFQVALAGVSVWTNGNLFSFPAPMCSWFFKL